MLRALVPGEVRAIESFGDDPAASVFPEEFVAVRHAVETRRREFVTGRACAHRALAELGVPVVPIMSGPNREPLWPEGVVGSITHCSGYRAAAVATSDTVVSLGIDAETNAALPAGIIASVASRDERRMLAALGSDPGAPSWDRLLFSAKEAVYKAWYPLTRRWLDFSDADITFGRGTRRFLVRLHVPGPTDERAEPYRFHGAWTASDQHLVTAVVIRRE